MTKLVITIEVEFTKKEEQKFITNLFTSKNDDSLDAQADFVKDALRNPNNKIDWKLRR